MAESIYRGYVRAYQGSGREHQKDYLEQCAKEMGLDFKCYVDQGNLFQDTKAGDVVAVVSLDRISRDPVRVREVMTEIYSKGASLEEGGRELRYDSPEDKLFTQMASIFRGFDKELQERELRNEKIKLGIQAAKVRKANAV